MAESTPVKKHFGNILPNLVYVLGVFLLVINDLEPLAFLLVVLSKWQMFLGGRKLWVNNIRANAVDLLVAFSTIAILGITEEPNLQYIVLGFYVLWLIVIKPQSSPSLVALQAGIGQFLSLMVIFLLERYIPGVVVIILAYISAYITAEHFFTAHDDRSEPLLKLAWALIVAQVAWVLSRWVVLYPVFEGVFAIPQAAVVVTLIGYIFGSMYLDHTKKKLKKRRLFSYIALLAVLLLVVIAGTTWDARI